MFNKKLLKKLSALLTVTAAALSFGACNSDDDITNETNLPYSCQLLNFALSADSSVDFTCLQIFTAPVKQNILQRVFRFCFAFKEFSIFHRNNASYDKENENSPHYSVEKI